MRRLAAIAFLPIGVGLTSWNYLWRTTPMHRRDLPGSTRDDMPPPLPDDAPTHEIQGLEDGVGPLLHRRFRVEVVDAGLAAEDLVRRVAADPNCVSPREFATFVKTAGEPNCMQVGDEFLVRMPGPWDGPVRAVAVTPTSFRFATLAGHLEAGQIEFRALEGEGALVFEIEVWARSGDWLSNVLFQHLRMAKEIQLHMWTSVLERVARLAGGRIPDGIDIDTRRVTDEAAFDR